MEAMKGTAAVSLQVACNEAPFDLRRTQTKLKYLLKMNSMESHSSNKTLEDYPTPNINLKFYTKLKQELNEYLSLVKTQMDIQCTPKIPPWKENKVSIDTSILYDIKFKESEFKFNSNLITSYINEKYRGDVKLYTDGSRINNQKVSASICIPEKDIIVTLKLPDNLSSYTAELTAIWEALKIVCSLNYQHSVIISDSLYCIKDIHSNTSKIRPGMVQNINNYILQGDKYFQSCWVPGHSQIEGNELADKAASEAHSAEDKTVIINQEIVQAVEVLENHVRGLWQTRWENSKTGCKYKEIYPNIPVST